MALRQLFDHGNNTGWAFDQSVPEQVASDQTTDSVAEFFRVNENSLTALKEHAEFGEEGGLEDAEIVIGDWPVTPHHTELVVIVEIQRGRDHRDDTGEALFANPDDFFLAANLAMIRAIATGSLTDGESLSDHPVKIAGSDALRPLPFTGHGAHAATTLAAWMALLTS